MSNVTVRAVADPFCGGCQQVKEHCTCPPLQPVPAPGAPPVRDWPDPVPLTAAVVLPRFPAELLPGWLAAEITAVAEFTQTPPDLAGAIALAVLSATAGGRIRVQARGRWHEPTNLYVVAAMPPGSRKSAVFAELTGPLLTAQKQLADAAKPRIVEAATRQQIALRRAEKAIASAGDAKDRHRDDVTAAAVTAAQHAADTDVPVPPRLVADDIVAEAATSLLAAQGGRIAILSAEGGIFTTIGGRYSSGVPNMDVFLKGHSGDMISVDRKGRPPEYIPQPAITLGICLQPAILRKLARIPEFRDLGLLARILYVMPPNLVGQRRIAPADIPPEVTEAYSATVNALVHTLWAGQKRVLTLDPAAARVLLEFEHGHEPRLDGGQGDLAHICDWGAKLPGAAVRIAGLLHLSHHLRDGYAQPVDAATMRAAAGLAGYFTAHALAAFEYMGATDNPVIDGARAVLAWLQRTTTSYFSRRQAHVALSRSRFPTTAELDQALSLLTELGYLRPDQRKRGESARGPGRPVSPSFQVHPCITTKTTETTKLIEQ